MGFNIGSKIVTATGGSVHRTGNYRVHQFPSQHVTEGLALYVDFGDERCWNGSAFDVKDLSPMQQVVEPITGTGFGDRSQTDVNNQANGRSMVFNRSWTNGHRVEFQGPLKGFRSDARHQCTFEAWAMATTNQSWNSVIYHIGSNRGIGFHSGGDVFVGGNGGSGAHHYFGDVNITAGTWTHIIGVYENNDIINDDYGSARLYVNGVNVGGLQDVGDNGSTSNGVLRIGNWSNSSNSEGLDGRIAIVRLYNRALSADEVAQNYNAEKLRFSTYTETFAPKFTGNGGRVEALVVAGGGGGGNKYTGGSGGSAAAGGGGAGGLLHRKGFLVTDNVTVAVGAGGTGGGDTANGGTGDYNGHQGGDSTFSTLTAWGGGYGGGNGTGGQGGNGTVGSGGGAGNTDSSGPAGTTGQGNRGGRAAPHDNASGRTYPRGGGGGAGTRGGDGGYNENETGAYVNGDSCGDGGLGLEFDITGEKKFYAGGGGAGSHGNGAPGLGGSGIGGEGSNSGKSNHYNGNGIPDTGSGGAGNAGGNVNAQGGGGQGGNGTVIVRYPAEDYNAEVLIVAGGGGGGGDRGGGGGGAGGVLYYDKYHITSGKNYLIEVGRGGYGGAGDSVGAAGKGIQSKFDNKIAVGGGGGGVSGHIQTAGGSGGGCRHNSTGQPDAAGGLGTLGQGNDGGAGAAGSQGSGGGGAGEAGMPSVAGTNQGGDGGDGRQISITGTDTYYGGGGGGGGNEGGRTSAGGQGGGGQGKHGNNNNGTAGTANTGGGGGGGGTLSGSVGGAGGSGIVIVAYKGPQRGIGGTIDTTTRSGYTLHKFTSTGYFRFVG